MTPPLYLVAYDIADPRRLGRVHRFLKKEALPLQYSVFLASAGEATLTRLAAGLRQRIEERRDDVRIYRLPAPCQVRTVGRRLVPAGLNLAGLNIQRLDEDATSLRPGVGEEFLA